MQQLALRTSVSRSYGCMALLIIVACYTVLAWWLCRHLPAVKTWQGDCEIVSFIPVVHMLFCTQNCFLQKEARVCVSNGFVTEDSKFKWCSGWPRSGWPLSTTLCYKSVTGLNHHTKLLLIFYMVGSDIRKKYWKFHNDTVNSFGVMGKGNAIFQPYFHVTMSHFKFSYFLNSCLHKIEVLEQFIDFDYIPNMVSFDLLVIWCKSHGKWPNCGTSQKNWFRYTF